MLKKTITYTDYDGNSRTEDYYFNLNQAELMEMSVSINGGLENLINKIIAEKDNRRIFEIFKEIIVKAYGEKSLDGKRFMKSEEISNAFLQSEAYNELMLELLGDAKAAAKFIELIIPTIPEDHKPASVN